MKTALFVVGSFRAKSFNRQLAREAEALLAPRVARLLALAVLAGAATGCKTEQCEIVERPDTKTGEIRRYCMKGPMDKIIWREDIERLKKIKEEERLRNEPNGKKELLPPPGKRVVYRNRK